ncbi:lytic transglycosylase domain-containing protein [Nocardia sp. NEAU-G5]|uniref:Lytic transglycosylase domain-containing protein n=1 Tax=Nocardia albiluteola TaxID=2842303 RepID=A0ABS6BB31_9NOCA|nr:lytic transglycosylase domain-containing protein [Nocardia albiluteola]
MLTRVPGLSSPVGPDDLDDGVVRKSRTGRGVIPAARAGLPAVAALVLSGCLALSGCGSFEHLPPIPDGIPPAPGAPTPAINLDAPGRTAEQLHDWAAARSRALSIPVTALEAYGYAAAVMARSHPDCGIGWTTVAAIAYVESRHGSHGGAHIDPGGNVAPPIRGIPLDGSPGVARILDQDATARTGSPVYVRAMGPFQFLPETWQRWGVDANGDGIADPDSIDDASLTAARYLCVSGGDLTAAAGWQRALLTYNQSTTYMLTVRRAAAAYGVGRHP